jgi:serine/threonine-protein kinase
MDYVEGLPLTALIRRVSQSGEPMPLQTCLDIVIQAARGLHAAHTLVDHDGRALELVHRDVSPHNLLVGFDGIVRVTDFGIARALGRRTQTSTGILKGKTGYMAPEMLRFEPIDRRADLFSLGVVLHELVAGKRLYRARDQTESARRILHEAPPDIGLARIGVPDELVRICFELLAKDPTHRPETAKEVARRLEAIRLDLVAVEGEHELDAYMRDNLDESEIRGRRASIQDLERRAMLVSTAGAIASKAKSRSKPSRPLSQSVLAVALVLAGVAVGLGVAFASGALDGGGTADAAPVPAELPEASAPRAAEPEPSPEPVHVVESSPEEPAPELADADPEPSVEAVETPAPTKRRRVRDRRVRRSMKVGETAVPVIDEY